MTGPEGFFNKALCPGFLRQPGKSGSAVLSLAKDKKPDNSRGADVDICRPLNLAY